MAGSFQPVGCRLSLASLGDPHADQQKNAASEHHATSGLSDGMAAAKGDAGADADASHGGHETDGQAAAAVLIHAGVLVIGSRSGGMLRRPGMDSRRNGH